MISGWQTRSPYCGKAGRGGARCGFTLIELILVMGLLAAILTVTAPKLQNFFRGRHMKEESRRMLALTRYARSEAISRGVPMEVWIDATQKMYGLRPQFEVDDNNKEPLEYKVNENLDISFDAQGGSGSRNEGTIVYMPDGSIEDDSVDLIVLKEGNDYQVRLARSEVGFGFVISEQEK